MTERSLKTAGLWMQVVINTGFTEWMQNESPLTQPLPFPCPLLTVQVELGPSTEVGTFEELDDEDDGSASQGMCRQAPGRLVGHVSQVM